MEAQPGNDHSQETGGKNSNGGNLLCRQSSSSSTSSRWTPTTDQIRILKDLYYNNGVRSPSAEQIQRISAKLRQYGKIEGKNVFYWFQNHKARERQKKRLFTPDHHIATMHHRPPPAAATPLPSSGPSMYHHNHHHLLHHPHVSPVYSKFSGAIGNFPCASSSYPSSSSAGVMMNVGSYGGYGSSSSSSMAVEKSFREWSIAPSGGSMQGQQYFTWIGFDPCTHSSCSSSSFSTCSPYPCFDKRKYTLINSTPDHQTLEIGELEGSSEIETLPLFPMHGLHDDGIKHDGGADDHDDYFNGYDHFRGTGDAAGSSRASLELTLNSYAARLPNSP